ncbi:hypothetical protein EZV73_10980 [Acidaminobacter sp. JC074]|uniref:hypothetical protein n=1 Tax=Acidaminobacter sp. JC074 TaxID=2530199 RepID=UPI001F0D8ABA|nr:hypothetical protein [Acidaminobacter sp. JC074]MCH4888100.1 hypothetical protein [Acidaminobacter sp. JC074]
MSKQTKVIVGIIAVLILVIGVTAYLNKENVAEKAALNNDAVFIVKYKGEDQKTYSMEDIRALGETDFVATKDTSDSGPEEFTYTGVPLIKLYEDAGVSVGKDDTIINVAADGYTVALEGEKVVDAENVYITYMVNGEAIGTRDQGGSGPYMIIVSKDQFSQFWCKYALSTDVQ